MWVPLVQETDALLVGGGGDLLYLCHWMRESGLVDLLPSLTQTVWVGLSSGSIDGPAYAVDDQTAFKVVDSEVEVISEGQWKRFTA